MACRKIYFAGSEKDKVDLYAKIIRMLQKYGTVLTEHTASGKSGSGEMDKQIHDRIVERLTQSDVLVAEVTQPRLGTGYEIGRAIEMKKKILCLFRPASGTRLSSMVRGACNDSHFHLKKYSDDQVEAILQEFFTEI